MFQRTFWSFAALMRPMSYFPGVDVLRKPFRLASLFFPFIILRTQHHCPKPRTSFDRSLAIPTRRARRTLFNSSPVADQVVDVRFEDHG